jgi:hypothetical protein
MTKDFDAVEMKRRGQELLRQKLAGMTREQRLAYWAQRNAELEARIRQAREQPPQQHKRPA